jgi:predicted RNase H-like nuclease
MSAPQARHSSRLLVTRLKPLPATIAVDMPIGLPETVGPQPANAKPAPGWASTAVNSVFAVPSRSRRDGATTTSPRAGSTLKTPTAPQGVEAVFHAVSENPRDRRFEITPELQCTRVGSPPGTCLLGHERLPAGAVTWRRRSNRRPSPEGMALRRELLARNGFPVSRLQHPAWPKSKVAEDDILDACACAWSAARIARGEHISLPAEPEFDARGLRMQISA